MAFSPDSRHLAVIPNRRRVDLWDLNGRHLAALGRRVDEEFQRAAFSPDGTIIVTTHKSGVKLWTWQPVESLRDLPNPFPADYSYPVGAALAPDNQTAAIAGQRGELFQVDVATGRVLARTEARSDFRRSEGRFGDLAFAPDGNQVAAGFSGNLHLWDLTAREPDPFDRRGSACIRYVQDGESVATLGHWGLVVKELASGRRIAAIETTHAYSRWAGAISADGRLAAFAHQNWPPENAEVVLREVATGKRLGKIALFAQTIALSPDGRTLATWWDRRNQIELWDVSSLHALALAGEDYAATRPNEKAEPNRALHIAPPAARSTLWLGGKNPSRYRRTYLAFTSDGQFLAAICASELSLWNPATGEQLASATLEGKWARPLGFLSGDTGLLVVAQGPTRDDELTQVYQVPSLTRSALRVPRPAEFVQLISVSPDGKMLAGFAGAREGSGQPAKIIVWDVGTRQVLAQFVSASARGSAAAFSHDGKSLAFGSSEGEVSLYSLPTGTRTASWQVAAGAGWVVQLLFSPDDRFLAAVADVPSPSEYDGPIAPRHALSLWDIRAEQALKTGLDSGEGAVRVAFSPDSSLLTITRGATRFWLWDLTQRTWRRRFTDVSYRGAIAFSPDGRTVATDGRTCIRLWDTAALLSEDK
jgi:WD40 repeat protein